MELCEDVEIRDKTLVGGKEVILGRKRDLFCKNLSTSSEDEPISSQSSMTSDEGKK